MKVLLFVLALSVVGCRAHPCGERSASLPAALESLPLLTDGGKVCDAGSDSATIMYWGDRDRMSAISVKLITDMDGAGFSQYESKNEFAPPKDPEKPVYIFRKGDEEVSVRISRGETPRFGAKLPAESITLSVHHHVLEPKTRRKK